MIVSASRIDRKPLRFWGGFVFAELIVPQLSGKAANLNRQPIPSLADSDVAFNRSIAYMNR